MNSVWLRLAQAPIIGLLIIALVAAAFAQTGPPVAPVREVTDVHFGQKIVDPYRWMEDLGSSETQGWLKAQATYADNYLQRLPGRGRFLQRLTEVNSASVAVSEIRQRGELFFYLRRAPDEDDYSLYVRPGLAGAERRLVDPNRVKNDGKRYSLNNWNPSFDGKYVSYRISAGGDENGVLRVVEVSTGNELNDEIDRVRFGAGDWLPDGKSFLYNRLQKLPEGAPATEKYQKSRLYLHVLGADPNTDRVVFGFDVDPKLKFDQTLLTFAGTDPSWKFVLATLYTGVSANYEFYVAPIESLWQPVVPWRRIVSFADEVGGIDVHGDDLYLLTYKNTPRYRIVRTRLSQPEMAKAESIFPASAAVVTGLTASRDALYIQTLDGGTSRIWRVDYRTKKAEPLSLPYPGSASIAASPSRADGIYFNIVSWNRSLAHFRYEPATRAPQPTKLVPPSPIDMSGIEFVDANARSYDGTMIPLVIIFKKGLKRDGSNPVLMDGYGAYGTEYTSPVFDTGSLPWLEGGGVFVWTGIRGGGEYGEEWHLAGWQKTKPNTWKDFIACAEFLIAEKYTSPAHLGIRGGSAGGILIGNAIAERPDMFGAAIDNVGLNNPLRAETTANGVPNIPEFGSFKTEEGFKNLLAMDGYLKIKNAVKYPAMLLTTGINDPRVDPWMSAKMAARVQAATSSGKPVLLRIDYDAGHGSGTTKEQRNRELADEYAFLFQQLGN